MPVVDSLNVTGNDPNCEVIREIDVSRFKAMVQEAARP